MSLCCIAESGILQLNLFKHNHLWLLSLVMPRIFQTVCILFHFTRQKAFRMRTDHLLTNMLLPQLKLAGVKYNERQTELIQLAWLISMQDRLPHIEEKQHTGCAIHEYLPSYPCLTLFTPLPKPFKF